jgi:hypothetical protein
VHESVDGSSLRGRVLVVSATAGDRALLGRALRGTGMAVMSVASAGSAPDAAAVDVVMLTCNEGDDEPGSVLLDLYEAGFAGKALLITPDRSPRVRRMVDKLPLAGVLVKPLEDALLLRLLADILPEGGRERARSVA